MSGLLSRSLWDGSHSGQKAKCRCPHSLGFGVSVRTQSTCRTGLGSFRGWLSVHVFLQHAASIVFLFLSTCDVCGWRALANLASGWGYDGPDGPREDGEHERRGEEANCIPDL